MYRSLFTHADIIEITLFIIFFYLFTRYLFNQEDKTLLIYWYAYQTVLIGSYLMALSALFYIAAGCFPLIIVLMMIFHEQRLQKMFVVAQRVTPLTSSSATSNWLDELMKFALTRLNDQKDLRVIIENNDSISSLITTSEKIDALVKKQTLDLLYHSLIVPPDSFLWVTREGRIISLLSRWKGYPFEKTSEITKQTDCIAFSICTTTRTCTITHGSKIFDELTAHHALNVLTELQKTHYHKEQNNHDQPYHNNTPFSA